jgi:poly-gamma-glutamate synthesis protein (capsule biosynthesis protein)
MSKQTHPPLVLLQAESITKGVPPNIAAWQMLQRPIDGPTVRLCAVGDIGLSGRAAATAKRWGAETLFAEVAPVLQAADITFGNLESPLAGEIAPGKMFAAPREGAATLYKAGFNLIHLANNHVGEYGQVGLAATLDAVGKAGMIPLGAGENLAVAQQLVRTDVNGLRVGWLSCGRTLLPQHAAGPRYWEFDEQELLAAVIQARPDVDVLIVSMHIGLMFLDYPSPNHKTLAERLMRAGVNLVLMHHAHVLQGVQVVESGHVCCYNLGNFVWDYLEVNVLTKVMLDEQQESAVFIFDLDAQGIASITVLPTWIDAECRVRWASQEHGDKILRRLQRISLGLNTDYQYEFDRQRVERNFSDILRVLAFHARRGNWAYVFDQLRRTRFEHLRQVIKYVLESLIRSYPYGRKGKGLT